MLRRALLIALMLAYSSAMAQDASTLGHYLDQGARPLTAEQIRKLFAGRTVEHQNERSQARLTYEPDGRLQGTVKRLILPHDSSRAQGSWVAHDDGRMCVEERLPDFNETHAWCKAYFLLPGKLIIADSATDRSAPVVVRQGR